MGFDAQIFCFVCFIQSLYIKALVVCFICASNEIKSLSLLSLCALFISIFIHFSNISGIRARFTPLGNREKREVWVHWVLNKTLFFGV